MKYRPRKISMVERAIIAADWHKTVTTAQIAALIGDDSDKMVNKAGRVLFVVLGACIAEGVDPESTAMRMLVGAVNAVHDQAGNSIIPAMSRKSIVSGLETAVALIPQLQRKSLVDAACDLALKLRTGNVHLSHFPTFSAY
jgi:hypothetical protein